MCIIIVGIVLIILGTIVVHKSYEAKDAEMKENLDARNYWRWKNGGID